MASSSIICPTRNPLPPAEEEEIHFLPCSIDYNGSAPVSMYFLSQPIDESKSTIYKAALRGRELTGKQHLLEDYNMIGLVLDEDHLPNEAEENVERLWAVENQFNRLISWNPSYPETKEDYIQNCLNWSNIAQAIHTEDL